MTVVQEIGGGTLGGGEDDEGDGRAKSMHYPNGV